MPRVLPFAGLRYAAPSQELERLVSPPYDVISPEEQAALRALDRHNVIYVELAAETDGGDACGRYRAAAQTLARWRTETVVRPDPQPAFYLAETAFTHAGQTLRRRDLL